jgi:hypothetical protein
MFTVPKTRAKQAGIVGEHLMVTESESSATLIYHSFGNSSPISR